MSGQTQVAREDAGTDVVLEAVTVDHGGGRGVFDIDLVARPGTLTALTGHSGAGKTTLLWAVAGLVSLTAGRVSGADDIAVIPQGSALAALLSAHESVRLPLLSAGVPAIEAGQRASAALEAVGLAESATHLADELSGGQQQRVAVARGLARRARVLIADEPTSELDHDNRERVVALLRGEAERGAVVLLATHDPEVAARADAVLALDR